MKVPHSAGELARLHISIIALASLLALGCGGKGGGVGADTASVSATPATIPYGADARVAWSAASSASFDSSNFGPDASSFHGGSITDTPGTTTTYQLKVVSSNGNRVPARATVTVAPMATAALVVGDAAQPGPAQIGAFLRTLSSGVVDTAAAVPAPSATYGLLVVSPTVAYSPGAAASVKAWLDAGKGVVLCGKSPRVLATGDPTNNDVSAIGSWFFGVSVLQDGGSFASIRPTSSGLVRISAVVRGQNCDNNDSFVFVENTGPQVDSVGGIKMCAYAVPSGGKLVWSASPVGFGAAPGGFYQQAFESSVRWAGQ